MQNIQSVFLGTFYINISQHHVKQGKMNCNIFAVLASQAVGVLTKILSFILTRRVSILLLKHGVCVCVHGEVMLDDQQKQEGKKKTKKHRNRELKVASFPDLGKKVQANYKERLNKTKPSKQNLKFFFRNFGLNFNVVSF